jgi:hypothetical protein
MATTAVTWEVWDVLQGAKMGTGRGVTPSEAFTDWAPSWRAGRDEYAPAEDDDGPELWEPDWDEDPYAPDEPGIHSVHLRAPAGEWWAFGGTEWQRTPDKAAVRAAMVGAVEMTDRYGIIPADPDPGESELQRRQGIQWWVDCQLIAEGLERLCRCIVCPDCAGNALLARACWEDAGPQRYSRFVERSNRPLRPLSRSWSG